MADLKSYEQFREVVRNTYEDKPVVVKFYTNWTDPCNKLTPEYSKIALKNKEKARFYRVEMSDNSAIKD